MFKNIIEIVQNLATLTRDIEETRREIKELRKEFNQLIVTVQGKLHQMEMGNHTETTEREKLALELKLEMEKFSKQLPPARRTKKS